MKIGYQHRYGRPYGGSGTGYHSKDLPSAPQLRITNHFLKKISGFGIGDHVLVTYSLNSIVISKITS